MKKFTLFIFSLFILSCANQGYIEGGQKDETPPTMIGSVPQNKSLNFSSKSFEIFFDENIKVQSIKKNLLISPFMDESPKVKVRPKSIVVELKEELQPNTTYSFNFGNAIKDLNEGNELSGFTYVFSTGEKLDSASLNGFMITAIDGSIPKNGAWALLYKNIADSAFTTLNPDYATPIQEDGRFKFSNVKDGDYKLYGLRDNNFNYYYDLPDEEIAFFEKTVTVKGNQTITEPLYLFTKKFNKGYISKSKNDKQNSLLIETSDSSKYFEFTFLPAEEVSYKNQFKDSIRLWFKNSLPDSAFVTYKTELIDTIKFKKQEFELRDSIFKLTAKNAQNYVAQKEIYLKSNVPFELAEMANPILLEDSLFVAGGVELKKDTIDVTKLYLDYDWALGKEYTIEFDDSTFIDFYGRASDSLQIQFNTPQKEDLSTLKLNFKTEKFKRNKLIVNLLNNNEILTTTYLNKDKTLIINSLKAGNYKLQVIIDENENGQWDTGSYEEKKQPEKSITFETPIELRANWDMDVDINLDE